MWHLPQYCFVIDKTTANFAEMVTLRDTDAGVSYIVTRTGPVDGKGQDKYLVEQGGRALFRERWKKWGENAKASPDKYDVKGYDALCGHFFVARDTQGRNIYSYEDIAKHYEGAEPFSHRTIKTTFAPEDQQDDQEPGVAPFVSDHQQWGEW
jgi:hypothetical protein